MPDWKLSDQKIPNSKIFRIGSYKKIPDCRKIAKLEKLSNQKFSKNPKIVKFRKLPNQHFSQMSWFTCIFSLPLCILINLIPIIWHNARIYNQTRSSNRCLKIAKCQFHFWKWFVCSSISGLSRIYARANKIHHFSNSDKSINPNSVILREIQHSLKVVQIFCFLQ